VDVTPNNCGRGYTPGVQLSATPTINVCPQPEKGLSSLWKRQRPPEFVIPPGQGGGGHRKINFLHLEKKRGVPLGECVKKK